MGILYVKDTGKIVVDGAATASASFGSAVTPGNAVICSASSWIGDANGATGSFTDNQGNTYGADAEAVGDNTNNGSCCLSGLYSAPNVAASGTFTVTHSLSAGTAANKYHVICASEVSGLKAMAPADPAFTNEVNNFNCTGGDLQISSSADTSQAETIVFTVFSIASSLNPSINAYPTGYTGVYTEANGLLHAEGAAAYRIRTTVGSETGVTWDHTQTPPADPFDRACAVIVAYRAAPSGYDPVFTDDFSAGSLGAAWTNGQGAFTAISQSGGVITAVESSDAGAALNTGVYGPNQYAKAVVGTLSSSGAGTSQIAAVVYANSTDSSCYVGYMSAGSGVTKYQIYRVDASLAFTIVAETGGPGPSSFSAGDYVRLRVDANGILVLSTKEGAGAETVRLIKVDKTITSGRPGVAFYRQSAAETATIADFEAGNWTPATSDYEVVDSLADFETSTDGTVVTNTILDSAFKGLFADQWVTISDPAAQTQGAIPEVTIEADAATNLVKGYTVNGEYVPAAAGSRGIRFSGAAARCIQLNIPGGVNVGFGFYFRWNGAQIDNSPRDLFFARSDPTGNYQGLQGTDGAVPKLHVHWQPGGAGVGNDVDIQKDKYYWIGWAHVDGGQTLSAIIKDPVDGSTVGTSTGSVTGAYTGGATTIQIGLVNYAPGAGQSFDFDNIVINFDGTVPDYPAGTPPPADQVALPNADVSDGTWTPSTGADNYAVINDASDATYSSTNSNSTLRVGLAPLSTPDAGTQTVHFRANGSPAKKLIVQLIEGASTVRGSLTVDPLTETFAAYSFNPSGISDYADLDLSFEVQDATSPPASTVTWGAVGTGASGTTSCAPSYPAGISAATSKLYCVVTGRSNTANTAPTMPAGWTNILDFEGGTGTWGVDAGTRRVTVFRKDTVDGTETGTVTVSLAGTTANTLRATIHRVEVPSGYGISEAVSTGADTTAGTGFSATGSTNISFQANDLLMIVVASSTDSATQSAQSITASGITFGTLTNRASTAVTNGNDHRHIVDTVPVSSGSGTVAPTYAYTASASTSGPAGFLRLRAVAPSTFARVSDADFTIPAEAPATGPVIDFSITEQNDTLSSTAVANLSISLITTDQNDSLTSSLSALLNASAGTTDQNDNLTSTALANLLASLSSTEQPDTLTSELVSVLPDLIASLSVTESGDTLLATAVANLVAVLSSVDANDSVSASAVANLLAVLSVIEQNDEISSLLLATLDAQSSTTDQNDTLVSSMSSNVSINLTQVEQGDTLLSALLAALVAASSTTDQSDTLLSALTANLVANLSLVEQADTLASTLAASLVAVLSTTDQNDTLDSTMGTNVTINLSITEQNDALTSALLAALVASSSVTYQGDTLVSSLLASLVVNASTTDQNDSLTSTLLAALVANSSTTDQGDSLSSTLLAGNQRTIDFSIIEQNDALTSTLSANLQITSTTVDQNDTLLANIPILLTITSATIDQPDTLQSTISAQNSVNLVVTEQGDTVVSALLASLVASLQAFDQNDAVASSANAALQAAFSVIEEGDVLSGLAAASLSVNFQTVEESDALLSSVLHELFAQLSVQEASDLLNAHIVIVTTLPEDARVNSTIYSRGRKTAIYLPDRRTVIYYR